VQEQTCTQESEPCHSSYQLLQDGIRPVLLFKSTQTFSFDWLLSLAWGFTLSCTQCASLSLK